MKIRNLKTITTLLILFTFYGFSDPEHPKNSDEWVRSKMEAMTLDEKIGQLFMIRAHSNLGAEHEEKVEKYIRDYKVGSLCFFQGTPTRQAELTNRYQQAAETPLLIAIDGEWGLGMRFPKTAISFPRQLMLGAVQDNHLIYEMGREVADQMKRIGVHINFAPVVDVNNNPDNPVINDRSFGEDPNNVASKAYAYMKGMQDNGLMACAKHFPGHGDTDTDSHYALPLIKHDLRRLDSVELMPFKLMADQGVQSMMVAHLHVPAIDSTKNLPTSLSGPAISGFLKDSLGFEGLIFTDALEMKGVTEQFPSGELEYQALNAGVDVLCLPMDLPKAFETLKNKVLSGELSEERIDASVEKILKVKFDKGLIVSPKIVLNNLNSDIHNSSAKALKKKLVENAITLTRDNGSIPLDIKPGAKIASLSIGSNTISVFQKSLAKYSKIDAFNLPREFSEAKANKMMEILKKYDKVVVGIHGMNKYSSKQFGIHVNSIKLLGTLERESNLVINLFGSPYALKYFDNFESVVVAYNDENETQEIVANCLLGEAHIKGLLPISAGKTYKFKDGLERRASLSLGYADPDKVGISADTLEKIDEIIKKMIAERAAPGCQIFIAKDGKVVYNKSHGYHTYAKKRKVKNSDIYDLASITKVAASTIAVMKLNEEGKLNIGSNLSQYVSQLDTTNKKDLKVYDIMAHHAGLAGWIPFYKQTISNEKKARPLENYYSSKKDFKHKIPVANDLYMRTDYVDSIWTRIYSSDLRSNNNYRYSDLGFYLISDAVKNITGKNIYEYCEETFYGPLGLERTLFNPLEKFPKSEIVPSENDTYFRGQTVQGYVHDMGSAMLGGISGHAGLFSNSYELGVIMQMLLNSGYYGNQQFLKPETIKLFTQRHPRSTRRGIGFDMKELNEDRRLNVSIKASDQAFGHTGFTGTYAFVDPDYDLVFVMLSNRTFPSMNNTKYVRGNYREDVHTLIYNAMGVPDKETKKNN